MKKILFSLIFLVTIHAASIAQWTGTSPLYTTANVGIGTSAPNAKLQVIGNAIIGQNVAGANAARLDITSGASNQDAKLDFGFYSTFDASIWNIGRWGVDGSFRISDFSAGPESNKLLITTAGKVGIGTTAPTEKLNVQDGNMLVSSTTAALNTIMGAYKISYLTTPNAYAGMAATTNGGGLDQLDLMFYTAYGTASEKMRIMSNSGFVGIGTSAPAVKLDIVGPNDQTVNFQATGRARIKSSTPGIWLNNLTVDKAFLGTMGSGNPAQALGIYTNGGLWNSFNVMDNGSVSIGAQATNTNAALDVTGNVFANGRVLIGMSGLSAVDYTNKISANNYLLAVNGTAIFHKAKVKQYTSWPDYVFEEKYNLLPLDQLASYVQANKHLPEVPSADEVEKNGIDLGDNQTVLLKKIEELTLYIIEQNNKINKQQEQINSLLKAKSN